MKNKKQIANIIRWTARIWSLLSLAFMLFMVGGHIFGSEPQSIIDMKDLLMLVFFPTGVLTGLFLAWKWEGTGGIATIGSIIGLYVLRPDLILDPLIASLVAPGVLFLIYWLLSRKQTETTF
ncbi:MAG TPA: hypothetical protein EYN38_11640 [Flavobacteriales bacterium]|nr:hypothetical protein [Flavobacteriales bacterium]HIA10840.1 hypothetical protein [Flavobacteriales bacterium]HIO73744.1 hypothetical protein [Flavobacteriales bacterium]